MTWLLIAHGGCGDWSRELDEPKKRELEDALWEGVRALKNGNAIDSVEVTVKRLEDSKMFNAGLGSVPNMKGYIEMDSSIMDGKTLKAGAVAQLTIIKNPIRLARLIMEKDRHLFYAGWEIEKRGILDGLEVADPLTEERRAMWIKALQSNIDGRNGRGQNILLETVGAVAIDKDGNVASASSTGGLPLKSPGRISDTAVIGAGIYADNSSGGAAITGIGEIAIRITAARYVCFSMEMGYSAQEAVDRLMQIVNNRFNKCPLGAIAADKFYRIGFAHNTPKMSIGYIMDGLTSARIATSSSQLPKP
ncbi:MAG: isoaspartyl peptidase/L-asparaginase [Candidatus Caldarchaeales archaeon]